MKCEAYDDKVFSQLLDFEDANQRIDAYKHYLPDLGALICRHGLHENIGITMLHRHFSLTPAEILCKRFLLNEAISTPAIPTAEDEVIPYSWKLYRCNDGAYGFFPLEFVADGRVAERSRQQALRLSASTHFLGEIGQALIDMELIDVFGLATLHNQFAIKITQGQYLSERTNRAERTIRIRPELRTPDQMKGAAETLWRFIPSDTSGGKPELACDIQCTGTITVTAVMHCTCGPHRSS